MEQLMQDMMKKVDEFHRTITNRQRTDNGFPGEGNYNHLFEELNETIDCHKAGNRVGVVDGLVDLIYVALGTLLEMGVSPQTHFDEVHRANMRKVPRQTERYGPNVNDAVKPDGWTPPDHEAILEQFEVFKKISPVFIELTKLRIKKGNNYNRGNVKRSDHFPLGDLSYFQVIWMKACRVRSMAENPDVDSRRLMEREASDMIVYLCFWLEFMKGIEIS